ncbi:MAG: [protein-PII] uridylyltransferase [Candidatus Hydrogenedentes bacterium]|nr:[protein-PII] uridylyltransferase [Candidatus Hydrogenedentota bacterium]
MNSAFTELVDMAVAYDEGFFAVSREDCVRAARTFATQRRLEIRERHHARESGANVVRMLTDVADTVLCGVFNFALFSVANPRILASRVALCALGGYGRGELSPYSDLDVCLLYVPPLDEHVEAVNEYLVPFLWDLGFPVGYSVQDVSEATALAKEDLRAFTSYLEGRRIVGDNTLFARLKLSMRELQAGGLADHFVRMKIRERQEDLPTEYRDLYHPEPNVKENAGGLRDFHTALWLLMMAYGTGTLEEVVSQGLISADEHLDFVEALDVIWQIRNELHFRSGKAEDRLTFANQEHVAKAFGYSSDGQRNIARFMQDYYAAARKLRRFLRIAARTCNAGAVVSFSDATESLSKQVRVDDGQLYAGVGDENWFAEKPTRLMEVFWRCARHHVNLSRATERHLTQNLHLVGDTFRSSEVVRRLFLAICNRPLQAGHALRQAALAGVLGRYIPEFAAVQGVIRYEDFHHYPVDEHTLKAIEALAQLPKGEDPVTRCLHEALEHLSDPYVLVMAVLFHDLGKAAGDVHVEQSVKLANRICRRIGLGDDDTERIAFLVKHHILMTNISQYRDFDDEHTVREFAHTMMTEQRLRELFLLSYCDLAAVGPNVWNEWKGALLLKLYLRTEKILLGRAETIGEEFWKSSKADAVRAFLPAGLRERVEEHLTGLGERYFLSFTPQQIARHVECVERTRRAGLALDCSTYPNTNMSEVVICTRDRQGLFAEIAGSFSSQLVDVISASLFTRPDGFVVDSFTVNDARLRRPLTPAQVGGIEQILRAALLDGEDIRHYVERSRRRLFALLQPRIPVRTRIDFDNHSSRTCTVIDIETGDRTGLLYDLARTMAEEGLNIVTARIVTDARRVRDSFYVTLNGTKIDDETKQEQLREVIHHAIHPRAAVETKGGST